MNDDIATKAPAEKLSPLAYWLVSLAVMTATLVQFLDQTIANVAVPHMQTALNASPDTITWVLTSFIVSSAVVIPTVGWVVTRFGTRTPFLLAVSAFIATSMLCGMAANLGQMVVFRAAQGAAAAFIAPLGQAILLDITAPSKHTRALGIWGMTTMLGPMMGPTLGGYLTDNFNWRWVFYVNLPVGVPALLILWRLLPDSGRGKREFDIFGYVFLALALASVQLMLDRGQQNDWFASPETLIELIVGITAFWIFLVQTRFSRTPLFPTTVVRNRGVLTSGVFGIVTSWNLMGVAAMLPMLFQHLYGFSVAQTGLYMAPRGLGIFILMMFIPRIMARLPLRVVFTAGFLIAAMCIYDMMHWSLSMPVWRLSLNSFIQGLGMGLLMVPINYIAFAQIKPELRTDCAAFLHMVRNMAGSCGISLLMVIVSRSSQVVHADLGGHVTPYMQPPPGGIFDGLLNGDTTMAMLANAEITRQATMIAYLDAFYAVFVVTLAAIPLCLTVRGKGPPV